jgi:gluconolactonase
MRARARLGPVLTMVMLAATPFGAAAQATVDGPAGRPAAIINLATEEGVRLVKGQWRYSDVQIVDVEHRAPGPDLRPSGPPIRTYDITPHAGAADFDDSAWAALPASQLEARKGNGRLSFNWYRITVTVPDRVGAFDPTGATVVFEIVVDDYAEVWVNGHLPIVLGQTGGPLVKGFNAPNRVVLGRGVRPGQQFQLAVFGMNGPVSNPPGNFIWVRSATLDFYRPGQAGRTRDVRAEVIRHDPALDAILPASAKLEKLADGFLFTEGPVWVPRTPTTEGYLLFSDPNANTIYRWSPDGQVSVFRTKSGHAGVDVGEYGQPGSNGLALDRDGRLTINEHGNRRVTRLEKTGALTILADRYQGKRLNSPNDLVYRSDGALYFTDPPFGLPKAFDDPAKELPFSGVFRLATEGQVTLLTSELRAPNGLAFSPDERVLYVSNADRARAVWMAYVVREDGSLGPGRVFFDATARAQTLKGAPDGMKADRDGHLFAAGPGGIYVLAPDGTHLGSLETGGVVSNVAWGEDGSVLYVTGDTALYRIRLSTRGAGF